MISYEKLTMEDALIRSFKDDSRAIHTITYSDDDDEATCSFTVTYKCPAKYAKAVLKDYLAQELKQQCLDTSVYLL